MPSVFLSYSHKDEVWKDRLLTHLGVLEKQGLLETWDDRRIGGGSDWFEDIQEAMADARVAVLLISANFLTSKFILGEEVPRLLERRKGEGLPVIPVLVRACAWDAVEWLRGIQARPRDDRALAGFRGNRLDEELTRIAKEILEILRQSTDVRTAPDRELRASKDDFLDRVEAACRLREPAGTEIRRFPGIGAAGGYLRVARREGSHLDIYPVGAVEHGLTQENLQAFLDEIDAPYRKNDHGVISYLVYGGPPPPTDLVLPKQVRVNLVSFVELQGLVDFRTYLAGQTAKLEKDPIYPPRLYVEQRMRTISLLGREEGETSDALAQVQDWLTSPHGRFLVLLGDFGTGKTFLLHELARRMGGEETGLVPILLQMRSLEKGRRLDELLAQHFAREKMEGFSPAKFRYMLEQGRIALLFDGFDELALRVTYGKAADHFETLLQAAGGNAKVVLTSRRQHFLSESQVKTVLAEKVESLAGHRLAILQPFSREQVRRFLVNFFERDERKAEARLDLIEKVNDLLGLSSNPRLLGFIADLPEDQLVQACTEGGEITAATLYELLLNRWLVFEFERVHPKGAPPGLSVDERWRAVTSLAMKLWQKTDRFVNLSDLNEEAAVRSVTFSPDGRTFASASLDKTVRLWQADSGAQIKTLTGHQNGARSVAFSPDGKTLASASLDNTIRLWQVDSGVEVRAFKGHQTSVWSVAFSPDGKTLASASSDNTIRLWQVDSGVEVRAFKGHQATVLSVAFSPDGKTLASASDDNTIRLWQMDSDVEVRALTGHRDTVWSVAFSPDGKALASGSSDRRVHLWQVDSGVEGRALTGHRTTVLSVAFSPDGKTLAGGSSDNTVRLWQVDSGVKVRAFKGHQDLVRSVAFSPDGKTLASASDDNTVRLWQVDSGVEVRSLIGHQNPVRSVAYSPDGKTLASASDDNTVRLWDVATGLCLAVLLALPEGWMAFSPDGRYKFGGVPAGGFWHAISLCRFEPGELDEWIPGLRLADDASFFDLPDWKPEVRSPLSTNPEFLEIIQRSRDRQTREGGLSSAEVRRLLDNEP